MSLFDEIQSRLKSSQPAAPAGSAQDAALAAFKAKTGKAQVGSAGPAASNVGEQVAQGAAQSALAQQRAQVTSAADQQAAQRAAAATQVAQQQADLAAQQQAFQIGQQTQAASAAGARTAAASQFATKQASQEALTTQSLNNKFKQATAQLASDKKVAQDDLFETFRQGNQELAFRKDALDLELTAQKLALSDKQYVDKIKQVGELNRLNNDLDFKAESQRQALGDNWDQTVAQNKFVLDMSADQNKFNQQLAQMDRDQALSIFTKDMSAANQRAIFTAVTSLGAAGAKSGVDYYNKPPADDYGTVEEGTPTEAGVKTSGGMVAT